MAMDRFTTTDTLKNEGHVWRRCGIAAAQR